ncbi:MAG: SLBB domain-containing protein [Bacteroides sp.]
MRRLFTLFLLAFTLTSVTWAQTMTDDQVVEYVKSARNAGKSQQQITQELMRRGVTKEQVLRIQKKYQNAGGSGEAEQNVANLNRTREMAEDTPAGEAGARVAATPATAVQIYGHNIFTNNRLTFEPNTNLATPANYRLGPGDEVIIDVWGTSETTIRQTITPEGSIHVTNLGPVYLSGKTVNEANAYVRQEFAKIYSGMSGSEPTTEIKLTLGAIRTIQVNIMGEVAVPGTYRLSSFSTVFHALYLAGGVNQIGSLRNIKVIRGKKTFAELDVYDLLMQGKMVDDVRLQEGDIVMVDTYEALVKISGKVKRPMYYEMKKSETVATLIQYAGGMMSDSYKKAVTLVRKSGREYQIFNVDDVDYSVFKLDDGDEVNIGAVLDRFENRVEIRGAVYRPGLYQLNGTVNTVKELIKKAEGVCGDAFLNRAILNREHEDLTHETMQIDLRGLLNGTVVDIPLKKNDVLYIPSIHDLQEAQTLTIHGLVARPGTYAYTTNMTIEDLVLQAGGLLEAASTTKVEVARRKKDARSSAFTTTIGETFTFDLKDGLLLGEGSDAFHLEPFDEVYIRKSPAYFRQQNVSVRGEVLFSGNYALSKKNERLSDLIEKAGGITPDAYVQGARLIRRMTEEEIQRRTDVLRMSNKGSDSISVEKLDLATTYFVGIDLQEALRRPGSDADMVLREGDELFVPEYVSTVKINGAVMYPNTVSYKKGERLRYYINQAGGFGNGAKKRKVYVVYLNGTVSRVKMSSKDIEPGCEIIVPTKDKSSRMSIQEVLGIGTTTASLAAVIASIVNLIK